MTAQRSGARLLARIVCSIVPLACLLSVAGFTQIPTSETMQFRIEAAGTQRTYDQESPFPIRCRFKNLSDTPITIVLPGLGSGHSAPASLGFDVTIRKANEKASLVHGLPDFRSDFCRKTAEKMDSNVECDSPRDSIDLQPHEEFVRTVYLGTLLGGLEQSAKKLQPGTYSIQITSSQPDSMLVSNELSVVVQGRRPHDAVKNTK